MDEFVSCTEGKQIFVSGVCVFVRLKRWNWKRKYLVWTFIGKKKRKKKGLLIKNIPYVFSQCWINGVRLARKGAGDELRHVLSKAEERHLHPTVQTKPDMHLQNKTETFAKDTSE